MAMERLLPRASTKPIGVCVSGGPDSMALLHLALQWGERPVLVVHINHGVREEAQQEEKWLKEFLAKEKVEAVIKRLVWEEGEKKSHEMMRHKRYQALGEVVREHPVGALLLGHHANDLIETFLERLQMASSLPGLAVPIPAVSRVPGADVPLLRPLLEFDKHELRASLPKGIQVLTDPSNVNEKYLRSRVRLVLERQPFEVQQAVGKVQGMVRREWAALEETARSDASLDVTLYRNPRTHKGLAALVALRQEVARVTGESRFRTSLVDNLAEWMCSQKTLDSPVSKYVRSGLMVTWRRRTQSFE